MQIFLICELSYLKIYSIPERLDYPTEKAFGRAPRELVQLGGELFIDRNRTTRNRGRSTIEGHTTGTFEKERYYLLSGASKRRDEMDRIAPDRIERVARIYGRKQDASHTIDRHT